MHLVRAFCISCVSGLIALSLGYSAYRHIMVPPPDVQIGPLKTEMFTA